ncbi:hypothetical protein CNBG_0284 [Cryptococcus deuterogattii R265]|uniref:uncharacterized protein n=1 Tax=Cryptococcus deuterogattii (strain R265) TaxID=294750 RepID=UPI0019374AA4|nr:hypothetical protein CNBG_0284 [Cryptococcus deuterogattii R265]
MPQTVLQPSYNIHPMHLSSGQPTGYDSSNPCFSGNPQNLPYPQGRSGHSPEGHVSHAPLSSHDRNSVEIAYRGPSIAYPQSVPNLSDAGLMTGSQATDENHSGSQRRTSDEASIAATGDNILPLKQLSEEPLLSWDEVSQAASRPTSSSQRNLQGKDSPDFQSKLIPRMEEAEELIESIGENKNPGEKVDHRKRKRNRTIRSCVPCHNHKRKCDRKRPCGRCIALGLTGSCVYEIDEQRDMNDPEVVESERLRRRVAELEQVIRELRQKAPSRNANVSSASAPTSLHPAPLASIAPGVTVTSSMGDSGGIKKGVIADPFARIKMEEAQPAENVAGMDYIASEASSQGGAPHMQNEEGLNEDYRGEPYNGLSFPDEEMVYDSDGRQVFLGSSAGKSMLRRLRELCARTEDEKLFSIPEDVAFTGAFPNLGKTFPFTTIWSQENFCAEIIGLLPNQEQSEILWTAWTDGFQAYFSPFHLPTVRSEYAKFFAKSTEDKLEIPLSSLAVFLMVCALGSLLRATAAEMLGHPDPEVIMNARDKGDIPKDPKDLTSSALQSELYLSAAYHALRLCSFMANPTVPVLQCQLLIQVYLLVSERATDAWAIGGCMIKQAIALGLHKDPLSLDPNMSMRAAEVRRRLWWSIAGFDTMLAIFFGRPSSITYYTTSFPQDRSDDSLSDAPGSARQLFPPSNVLASETTDQTYHTAYYQLTIPSFELLESIFHVDGQMSRSALYGWFSPSPDSSTDEKDPKRHTYRRAIRLAEDIRQWYEHLPKRMRVDKEDTAESLSKSRSKKQMVQTLGLCIKTWTLIMVIHRPYLRVDPAAYPESTEFCSQSAHMVLKAFQTMTDTTLVWMFWTMSYRAFQAGAVCAFLALRQPGSALAAKCLNDLRGAIAVFEDRLSTWYTTHPVQNDLRQGLVQLENLVTAATAQRSESPRHPLAQLSQIENSPAFGSIQAFPRPVSESSYRLARHSHDTPILNRPFQASNSLLPIEGDGPGMFNGLGGIPHHSEIVGMFKNEEAPSYLQDPQQAESLSTALSGDFNGPSPLALPRFWASMFGIKMDDDNKETSSPDMA